MRTNKETKATLGIFLKALRLKQGLTQEHVSTAFGWTTPQFVSNWERCLVDVPLPVYKKLIVLYYISESDRTYIKQVLINDYNARLAKVFG